MVMAAATLRWRHWWRWRERAASALAATATTTEYGGYEGGVEKVAAVKVSAGAERQHACQTRATSQGGGSFWPAPARSSQQLRPLLPWEHPRKLRKGTDAEDVFNLFTD